MFRCQKVNGGVNPMFIRIAGWKGGAEAIGAGMLLASIFVVLLGESRAVLHADVLTQLRGNNKALAEASCSCNAYNEIGNCAAQFDPCTACTVSSFDCVNAGVSNGYDPGDPGVGCGVQAVGFCDGNLVCKVGGIGPGCSYQDPPSAQ